MSDIKLELSSAEAQAVEQALWHGLTHMSADKHQYLKQVLQRVSVATKTKKMFEHELKMFADKLDWLMQYEGKFVLMQQDHLTIHNSYEDALREGYTLFGLENPFMVKRIEKDQVYFL